MLKTILKHPYYDKAMAVATAVFLLLLPWQTRLIIKPNIIDGQFFEYGTISLYLSDLAALSVLVLYFLKNGLAGGKNNRRFIFILAGLELFVFLSVFWAPDRYFALLCYARFFLAISLFWLFSRIRLSKAALYCAGISLFLSFLLAVFQFNLQDSWPNKYLGLAGHDPGHLGQSVVQAEGVGRFLRGYGSFDHPNILGGVAALTLVFCLIYHISHSARNRFLLLSLSVLSAWALLASWSRSGWLGAVAALAFLLTINFWQKNYLAQKKILLGVLTTGTVIFLMSAIYGSLLGARSTAAGRLESVSVNERISQYHTASEIIKDNFFTGVGAGNYSLYLKERQASQPIFSLMPVHNSFLLLAAEIGFFGFLFFAWFLSRFSQELINAKKYDYLALLLALIILMMLDHWLWSLHFGVLFFWTLLGIASNQALSGIKD